MSDKERRPLSWALSRWTGNDITWGGIDAALAKIPSPIPRGGAPVCKEEGSLPKGYKDLVRNAFQQSKEEFNRVLTPLRLQINVMNWILLPVSGLALAIGLICGILTDMKVVGGLVSAAGLSGSVTFALFSWRLGKDQALLELIPSTYQTLFDLALTPGQHCVLFYGFREELIAMRRGLRAPASERPLTEPMNDNEGEEQPRGDAPEGEG